jgi:hypothetical protein
MVFFLCVEVAGDEKAKMAKVVDGMKEKKKGSEGSVGLLEAGSRGDHFRFDSIFIKKITKPKFFFKKNRNQFKPTGFGSVWFFQFRLIKPKLNRTSRVF